MRKRKIVFNCTVNVLGGAVQNAVNFIKVVENGDVNFDIYYFLSRAVYKQVMDILRDGSFSIFDSPARSCLSRAKIKRKVYELEVDLVYTSAGPAYVDFPCKHIMGCSNPYLLNPSEYAINLGGGRLSILKRRLHTKYQNRYISLADMFIFQTQSSKNELFKNILPKPFYIVPNAVRSDFKYSSSIPYSSKLSSILIPSAYYKHKNLELVVHAFRLLKETSNHEFCLCFTVTQSDFERYLAPIINEYGMSDWITNLGPFKHEEALELYLKYDIILQPSVLEVFSTTYIEAISLLKPLVVCDLPFARDICRDYPYYFESNDIQSLANALLDCRSHYSYLRDKQNLSLEIMNNYGSQDDRVNMLISILEENLEANNV